MGGKKWNRIEAQAEAPPIETWPDVNLAGLPETDVEVFNARKMAISLYWDGFPVEDISSRTGIAKNLLPVFLKRCLALADDGRVYGFRALIPYMRIASYKRIAEDTKKLPQAKGGKSGLLKVTLSRFPDLEESLITLILKERKARMLHEHRLSAKSLKRIFLKRLEALGVGKHEWPFNTRYQGARTISRYMTDIQNRFFARSVHVREERDAQAHLATGKGIPPLMSYEHRPFSAVEIDAHRIQAFFSVTFKTPEGTQQRIQLERLWLLAMVDRESNAVLAYNVVYSSEVSADDVLKLIRKGVSDTWAPKPLTISGLTYPKKGGIPSGVIPECQGALWSALLLDGALAHLALKVRELCRKFLGFAVNWGPVGHFERRPNVERFFKSIEESIFKRLPSTTGSKPGKGRAKDAEKAAITYEIDADETEQLLDVAIAQYNGTETEGLSYMSPLEYIRYYIEQKGDHFMVRHLPAARRALKDAIPSKTRCTVRGGREQGRRPYIQLDRVHYTNPVLADSGHLVGTKLIIEINEDDFRCVRAYLSNGAEIGILTAQGRWGATPHSRTTRRQINSLIANREITISEHDDPVQCFLKHISTPKAPNGKKKTKQPITPKDATTAVRVAKESGLPLEIATPPKEVVRRPVIRPSAIGRPMPDLKGLLNHRK